MQFTNHIAQTIEARGIFQPDDLILVALSGGADSVALLLVLRDLGYKVEALHCNFQLRGEESLRDEQFVSTLCQHLDVPIHIKHFDTRAYAKDNKVSIEMAARDLRYAWFREQAARLHAQAIAVAHHRDDQAETLLLNIIRGTGLRGMAGMKYRNDLICRPLLDVSRTDILDYLSVKGQDHVTDSTNLEREALRNRIRLDILPALAQLNPNISKTLSTLACNVQDALPIYEKGLEDSTSQMVDPQQVGTAMTASPFSIKETTLTLLHEWAGCYGFTRTQLQNILTASTGRMVESASHLLLRDREHFILHRKGSVPTPPQLVFETLPVSKVGTMVRGNAYLDASLVKMPIETRRVKPNDSFTPLGMRGTRLISNYLTDLKLNRFEKQFQEVLTDASGKILWVVGHATDNHFRITPSTTDVLIVRIKREY